jgi:N-acetylglucosamine malate deacetylase 1
MAIGRRQILAGSGLALGSSVLGLPLLSGQTPPARRLKLIVAGGHPDDPESTAGGTMALFADQGHEVVALYLTRGEAGIKGKSAAEAAVIRTAEAEKACAILKARPRFVGQVDGATEINASRYDEVRRILEEEKPDVVLAQWPVDTHRDHRALSLLVTDAWHRSGRAFALFYTEAETGIQTQHFTPTHYVDISAVEPRKRAACDAHVSQNPAGFYADHEVVHRFRGQESGCDRAEAFRAAALGDVGAAAKKRA